MRQLTWLVFLSALVPAAAEAQTTQVSARAGYLFYDAGNDESFPMLQLAIEHTSRRTCAWVS